MIVVALVEKPGAIEGWAGWTVNQAGLTIKINYDDNGQYYDGGEDENAHTDEDALDLNCNLRN